MSKSMEQVSMSAGTPAGKIGQVIHTPEEQSRTKHQFSWKEIGALFGVVAVMVAIVGYGVYSNRARSEARITSIADPAPPASVEQALSLAAAPPHPAEISPPAPVSAIPQTKSPQTTPIEVGPEPIHADVYFDFGKSRLRADATAVLQQHAGILKKDGTWAVLIQGYTDRHGPTEYNRNLALRRAESVRQFLIELGVPDSALKAVSLGKDSTICDDQRPTCQRLNRRVHLEMVKLETEPTANAVPATAEAMADPPGSSQSPPTTTESASAQPNETVPAADQP